MARSADRAAATASAAPIAAGANRSIKISQLISTLKACAAPAINTLEQEYFSALQSASSYTLDGQSRFQLSYNNGQGRLSYSAPTPQEQLCFTETPYCISGRFLSYWRQNGGLAMFGLPLNAAHQEQIEGKRYLVQCSSAIASSCTPRTQRPYDVLLGRLGDERLRQHRARLADAPKISAAPGGLSLLPETQHNVCDQHASRVS